MNSMRFSVTDDARRLGSYLPAFKSLAGEDRWKKRAVQLGTDAMRSPWAAKIVADYHWLEMDLSARMIEVEVTETHSEQVTARTLAALRFAACIVEIHSRLSPSGRTAIQGRLRDGLKSGFAALYLEMEMAQLLLDGGFDVEFPDLEGEGRVDLLFSRDHVSGEIECKSQSADAGRKIHRRDFYRFIDQISDAIAKRAQDGAREILVVTVIDRFPHDDSLRGELAGAVTNVLADATGAASSHGSWYTIERESIDVLGALPKDGFANAFAACRSRYGDHCHAAGPWTASAACLVVVRSRKEDDISEPLLIALKKAHEQLSGKRPGFIAVQYNDIESRDLALPHLRKRAAILSQYLFASRDASHLAAVYFCAYAGLHIADAGVGTPGFACWNPSLTLSAEGLPFRHGPSDDEFAKLLRVQG